MPLTGQDILLYEKKDGIVIITLNRPERLNALTYELVDRVEDAFARFREDEDARVAIVCGAGRAFSVGRDLKWHVEQYAKDSNVVRARRARIAWEFRFDITKPTIAAIQGYAIAGGFHLAQMCDVRIAAEETEFGIAEAMWNLPAGWVRDLTRHMTLGQALELSLWADGRITAQRAHEVGFVNRVVPKEKLMDEAMSWAERMLYMGPRVVKNIKKILYHGFYYPPQAIDELSRAMGEGILQMQDTREGTTAFVEKRKPQFKGK